MSELVVLSLALAVLASAALVVAVGDLAATPLAARRVVSQVTERPGNPAVTLLGQLDRAFARSWPGRELQRQLELGGSTRRPLPVALVVAGLTLAACVALWVLLAPLMSVAALLLGLVGLRVYLGRGRERRREAFVAQMPELARVLANATDAGLSVSTAMGLAAEELRDPAGEELRRVSLSLSYGDDLETALGGLRERVPSREVGLLLSTVLVSARSGGSLVTALQTIADTLEQRKETRREVISVLAQSVATGYTVMGMGVAVLLLLNWLVPGSVETMTTHPVGIVALLVSGGLFAVGFVTIRQMTRITD